MEKLKLNKLKTWLFKWPLWIGLLCGVLIMVAIRFAFIVDDDTHYHANFGVFINSQRETFSGDTYYEEIAACSSHSDDMILPKSRVHMHNNAFESVHVHDLGVTWGHFFANLGWDLDARTLSSKDASYTDGVNGKLVFILNGREINSPYNELIKSEDKLLISFGNDDEAILDQQFNQISSNAAEINSKKDPSSCSGNYHNNFWERVKHSII
jgi:hypothetical protein